LIFSRRARIAVFLLPTVAAPSRNQPKTDVTRSGTATNRIAPSARPEPTCGTHLRLLGRAIGESSGEGARGEGRRWDLVPVGLLAAPLGMDCAQAKLPEAPPPSARLAHGLLVILRSFNPPSAPIPVLAPASSPTSRAPCPICGSSACCTGSWTLTSTRRIHGSQRSERCTTIRTRYGSSMGPTNWDVDAGAPKGLLLSTTVYLLL
jgi:hypothetical protein